MHKILYYITCVPHQNHTWSYPTLYHNASTYPFRKRLIKTHHNPSQLVAIRHLPSCLIILLHASAYLLMPHKDYLIILSYRNTFASWSRYHNYFLSFCHLFFLSILISHHTRQIFSSHLTTPLIRLHQTSPCIVSDIGQSLLKQWYNVTPGRRTWTFLFSSAPLGVNRGLSLILLLLGVHASGFRMWTTDINFGTWYVHGRV